MRFATLLSLLCSSVAMPGAAGAAAQAQAAPSPEIVVEGERDPGKRIDTYVRELVPTPVGGQLGKFLHPVCPLVLGLPDAHNRAVEARIRQVAAAVPTEVAPAPCTANLLVLVGRDKSEILTGLRKQFPELVRGVSRSQLKDMAAFPRPVAAWQTLARIGRDGMPLSVARIGPGADPVPVVRSIGTPSRIVDLTRPHFVSSVVIVESGALDEVSTRQLADYAVMHALAPVDATREGQLPARSILSLFEPGSAPETAPQSVTWWDFAFLKSLYATDNSYSGSAQRGAIAREMEEQLSKAPPDER